MRPRLLAVGAGGALFAAVCCFTPVLAAIFGAIGLAAWVMWLDFILLPLLVLFVGVTAFAIVARPNNQS